VRPRTTCPLPATRMSPWYWSLSLPASSKVMTVVLFQAGSVRVAETTYFGMAFILLANPTGSWLAGQALANLS